MGDLARQVRQGFYREQALRFQRGRDDVQVMVRYPENERRRPNDVERMRIRTASYGEVPFSYVADVELGYGYAAIQRTDGQRERADSFASLRHGFLIALIAIYALLPMILEKSVQAQFLIPMAVSLGFGILFATTIILVGVPVTMKLVSRAQDLYRP